MTLAPAAAPAIRGLDTAPVATSRIARVVPPQASNARAAPIQRT